MKIKELLSSVAELVEIREIIAHISIRCLNSQQAVREIERAEGCNKVGTDFIGDEAVADRLRSIVEDGELLLELDIDALKDLEVAYLGSRLQDYVDKDKEDELYMLDDLVAAAQVFVNS